MAASPRSTAGYSEQLAPSSPVRPPAHGDDRDDASGLVRPPPNEAVAEWFAAKGYKGYAAPVIPVEEPLPPLPEVQVNKMKHLKKEDGEPLWRRDIQYDFLKAVFDDEKKVFTNSYEYNKPKQCFADLYIDTMSRSTKTSKVLRDKLLSDREAAKSMAMVCLLVNVGRMNTTLNFFPEMRAQLRTYHAIPSLQAHQDPHAYKQLQDAPRLKSILKGGADDRQEPQALNKVKSIPVPRTNPVNLLFLICNEAAKIAELHFPNGDDFTNLLLETRQSSASRARAFLWIVWFYLESDFTEEGCIENPFGEGVDYGVDVANQGVPRVEMLTAEQEQAENVDTQDEIEFGRAKQAMRKKIIESDAQNAPDSQTKPGRGAGLGGAKTKIGGDEAVAPSLGILPRIRPSIHDSDADSTRSTPPPRNIGRDPANPTSKGRRGPGAPIKYQVFEGSSPGRSQDAAEVSFTTGRTKRPPTAHQVAVERNRNERVEHILNRGMQMAQHQARKRRIKEGAIARAMRRNVQIANPFADSEDEDNAIINKQQFLRGNKGVAQAVAESKTRAAPFREFGLGGIVSLNDEDDDFGEEASTYAAAVRRAHRRLLRWSGYSDDIGDQNVIKPFKRARLTPPPQNGDKDGDEDTVLAALDPDETEEDEEPLSDDAHDTVLKKPLHHLDRWRGNPRPRKSFAGPIKTARRSAPRAKPRQPTEDDLDDVEKELLGLGSGAEDEEDGDGKADITRAAADAEDEEDDQEDLDDMERTLLGKVDDSDSD